MESRCRLGLVILSDESAHMDSARNPAAAKFIAEGPHLDIWCYGFHAGKRCDRQVKLNAAEIEAAFGPVDQVDLKRLNRSLSCSCCGAKARDKRVEARWDLFDDNIARHRTVIAKEIEEWGKPQTQPMLLPGIGYIYPEDMGLVVPKGRR